MAYMGICRATQPNVRERPIPATFPAEFLEPMKTFLDVGNVQDGSQGLCKHAIASLTTGFYTG